MALLYPWATKEYLLWEMTLGQVVAYHNVGIEMKYGPSKEPDGKRSLKNMSRKEVGEYQKDARRLMDVEKSKKTKQQYRDKYGDI